MRVSEYYGLDRAQPTLDFVDVDVFGDAKVFLDPRALRLLPSAWADECVSLVQNFFGTVLEAIRSDQHSRARELLGQLTEPNETHLGLSQGRASGRALGRRSSHKVWEAICKSDAVQSGLLQDLEDTILMVEGVSSDIISDMTTNIIRQPLITYTRSAAAAYRIPLVDEVDSGPLWDPMRSAWFSEFVPLPVTKWGKLLLVPKVIVRCRMDYDTDEYYRHYLLEHLQNVELDANTELVRLLKNGDRRVTKKDLAAKYGQGKRAIVRETLNHPEVLRRYRDDKGRHYRPPLEHEDIAASEGTPLPDWDALIAALRAVPPGQKTFDDYERAIESLLSALFYPSLTNPQRQTPIHDGRKRIDLVYTNVGQSGFFWWLSQNYTAPHVFVECKNYKGDPKNPELDQLSGRFSPSRGQFGLLVCRTISDKHLFIQRCRDTASDNRGFIVPLDDTDIAALVEERKANIGTPESRLLRQLFEALVL